MPKILAEQKIHRACNVWNCDETGLRWVALPDRTIANRRLDGFKKAMDRITVLVTCNAAGTGRRQSVIMIVWKKSDLVPDTFWEYEGMGRSEELETADKVAEEQYAATDQMLSEFRQYFPGIMTAAEYAESLPGEDLTVEQPPTATEFVEQILASESISSDEEEVEAEPDMTEEQCERTEGC